MYILLKNLSIIFLLWMPFVCSFQNNKVSDSLLHPEILFCKIEDICREIWNDLDIIDSNTQLRSEWTQRSGYLSNQFLLLHQCIDNLMANPQEARIYLWDDIVYLIDVVELIEEKYKKLSTRLSLPDHLNANIELLVTKGKLQLEQLLSQNNEVVLC